MVVQFVPLVSTLGNSPKTQNSIPALLFSRADMLNKDNGIQNYCSSPHSYCHCPCCL